MEPQKTLPALPKNDAYRALFGVTPLGVHARLWHHLQRGWIHSSLNNKIWILVFKVVHA